MDFTVWEWILEISMDSDPFGPSGCRISEVCCYCCLFCCFVVVVVVVDENR